MKSNDPDPMFPPRPTALVQQILREILREGDLVIDATAGNGHDTLFLADCVGSSGRVLAFDVQAAAITSARAKVEQTGFAERVDFFQESHEHMESHAVKDSVAAIMFNLGYLPGDDHALTTETATTLAALEAAVRLLKPDGILSVVCYPGHTSGVLEAGAVENWMTSQATKGWRIAKYGAIATRRPAPFLLLAQRG